MKNSEGKAVLLGMVAAIQENKAWLGEVDGLIGDGDHGMNMNKGFTLFGEKIAGREISFTQGLDELGTVLFSQIGGSMGPIYGTIFMDMAEAGKDLDEIDAPGLAKMLAAGLDGLYGIVEARVGDKTLVDTLAPAYEALQGAADRGEGLAQALDEMKAAAIKGRDSTRDLVAKFGRSSRLGKRSQGVLDAGACSCGVILSALAEGMKEKV